MYKLRAGIAGFVTLLFLTPGVVLAKNYCISGFPNTNYILVGQGFKIPAKGKCKAWTGFNAQGNFPTAGMGCTSSDGSNFSVTLTTGFVADSFVDIDAISLSLPAQTGEYLSQTLDGGTVTSSGPASGIVGGACSTNTIPAVTEGGAASLRPSSGR